ncbi:ELMO domain-containing protein 3 [Phytophthora boehmeriae]|uniref:ELMO domain-containing protein 3 n=1 Tax=Phytophthora boehmeriae TaxID=109152 RepID=A0A8T1WPM9_9STRA|nr:ELMO domain-containing protein 3 [Phytophthora boehmeriae]
MNPVEDDSDGDSDVSEGIEEGESASLPPPLSLREEEDDDDDDILEVDAAVVSSLEIEQVQRISNRSRTSERQSLQDKAEDNITKEPDNPLLKALPVSKVDSTINFTLGEEVRVAHVTTLEPNGDFSDLHKVAGDTGVKVDGIFGISYQSMRKKNDESKNADDFADEAGYSLPSGPAFPDEREFENEVELSNDLVFSVATASSTGPGEKGDRGAVGAEDDEFVFDIQETPNADILSDEMLKSRRESLEAQKAKEEEKLLKELKHATDEEKRLLVSNNMPEASVINSTQEANDAVAEADALSLTELHGIYKRGLGDQEVLMNDDEKLATTNSESDQAVPVGRSMSVMGRILSKPYGTETIQEEENDSETEDYEVKDNRSDKTATECPKDKNLTENGDIDKPSEWKEITLVQHSGLQKDEKTGPSSTVKQQNSLEAGSCITYAEAADYYAEIPDVMQHRNMIVPEDFPRGSCLGCLSRPRLVFDGAIEERDRVFCIAATAFDTRNNVIVAVLQTIYKKIMKNTRSISLIGRHWEDIGFQGTDPSTDLRGCGVLSLLQMLCLVDTHPDLAHRFHTLSQHVTRHFPFACVLINITLQCVVALRTGALYPECNKHSNVFSGMNRLYLALTLHLHDAMQSRTEEIPVIMKDVLDRGRVNPTKTINAAFDGPTLRSPSTGVPMKIGGDNKEADTNMQFTEIGLHAIDDS